MAISEARQFLLDSMAYGLWADWSEESGGLWQEPSIEVGETREVDLTMEDESDDPESLYAALEQETGVTFDVEVDRDDDGEILGVMVMHGSDTASVTIKNDEELTYLKNKVREIAEVDD